jgi:hypothetical protein
LICQAADIVREWLATIRTHVTTSSVASFVLIGKSGHTLTLTLRRPTLDSFVVELTRDDAIVSAEQFANGPDAVLRTMSIRDEFVASGWTLRP